MLSAVMILYNEIRKAIPSSARRVTSKIVRKFCITVDWLGGIKSINNQSSSSQIADATTILRKIKTAFPTISTLRPLYQLWIVTKCKVYYPSTENVGGWNELLGDAS